MNFIEKRNNPGFIPLIGLVIILAVAIIAAGSIYYVVSKDKTTDTNTISIVSNTNITNGTITNTTDVICPVETKTCPDGTSVSRIAPSCEFAPCQTSIDAATSDWKLYTSPSGDYTIKYPLAWSVDETHSNATKVFFISDNATAVNTIETSSSNQTARIWADSFDPTKITNTSDEIIDRLTAVRVDTNESAQSYIGVSKDGKLYIFTSNHQMFTNGMLDTFKFAN